MNKFFAIATATVVVACVAVGLYVYTPEEKLPEKEVQIVAGKIEPGMTARDVAVDVRMDNEPVDCRVQLTGFTWDGYWEMADDEPVAQDFCVRLDVFYSLPKGYDVDNIHVNMVCDGGTYDGTGSISFDKDGNVEAWSHALYGKEPVAPDTQPTEEPTKPAEQPKPTTPPETQPQHTHNWIEQPGLGIVICTIDGAKNFKCSCGATKTETIPAPGHDLYEWSASSATCTRDGSKSTTCKRCGAGFVVEMPATGHTWSDWVKKTGLVHARTCSVCSAEEEARHNIPSGSVTCTDCGVDIIN